MAKNQTKKAPARRVAAKPTASWQLAVYQTQGKKRPALDFLSGTEMPKEVRRELLVTVTAVAQRDPRTFRTLGERWTFMKKPEKRGDVDMRGIAEARDKHKKVLYRLFCVVDPDAGGHGLSGPSVVLLDGDSKPFDAAMPQSVYRRIDRYRDDYWANRRVAKARDMPDWWPKVGTSPS